MPAHQVRVRTAVVAPPKERRRGDQRYERRDNRDSRGGSQRAEKLAPRGNCFAGEIHPWNLKAQRSFAARAPEQATGIPFST
jgi:hypothetical protein